MTRAGNDPARTVPRSDASAQSGAARLAEFIVAFSVATDLGTGQPTGSAVRASLLAVRLAAALRLDSREVRDSYYLALLHYLGCTTGSHQSALGNDLKAMSQFVQHHLGTPHNLPVPQPGEPGREFARATSLAQCEVAARLAETCGLWPEVRAGLWQMFERWDGRGLPHGLRGAQITRAVRVVQLARDAETFFRLGGTDAALAALRARSGSGHEPDLVDAFCSLAPDLLGGLEAELSPRLAALAAEPPPHALLAPQDHDRVLEALADFADIKSPFTTGHARRVAATAALAATQYGLDDEAVRTVRRAALVQDVGRVGVPSSVWEKPGRLTEGQWEQVRLHPYHTERVLVSAAPLRSLALLAPLHHERPDGSGYHRGLHAGSLPPAARLLAAADSYRALLAPRAHRAAFDAKAAVAILVQEGRDGRQDRQALEAVLRVAGDTPTPARPHLVGGLSPRELEVLRLIAVGHTNKAVAARLNITVKTVGHHVQHIYDKLGLSTRAAATLFAMQHDLIG